MNTLIFQISFGEYGMEAEFNYTVEEVVRFQRLFPNPSWLMSGRTSGHQNLVSKIPVVGKCFKAKH